VCNRYRFHPYQRDDRVRQAAEAADTDRIREALSRYPTHVQCLEDVLVPARTHTHTHLPIHPHKHTHMHTHIGIQVPDTNYPHIHTSAHIHTGT
jgi:hypothetical protein